MESKPLLWIGDIGKEYAKRGDRDSIKQFLREVRSMLKSVAIAAAEKGDMKTIALFSPWNVRESIEIIESAVLANNIELCKCLAYERWRANIMAIFSTRRGTIEIVEVALDCGADELDRIAEMAIQIGRTDILELLASRGYNIDQELAIRRRKLYR